MKKNQNLDLLPLMFCMYRVPRTGVGEGGKSNKLYGTLKVKKVTLSKEIDAEEGRVWSN